MSAARSEIDRQRPAYVVVTVAYRSRPLLEAMLARITPPTPMIVVDNSADYEDITDLVRARPMTSYIDAGGNIGFGAACNLAARVATQPFIAFVNPDADVTVDVLDRLVDEVTSDHRRSSAGPLLVEADGTTGAGSGGWLPTPMRAVVHATGLFRLLLKRGIWIGRPTDAVLDVEWIAGTCLVILTDAFKRVGGFAPRYFLYQEDMDLGRRLRDQGYRQIVVGDLRVRHVYGTSSAVSDVRGLAWSRASALVDYLAATHDWVTVRLMCTILGLGAMVRAGYAMVRGRTVRLSEFGTHALAFTFPSRTLKLVEARHGRRCASRPE